MTVKHQLLQLTQRLLRGSDIWIDRLSHQPFSLRNTLFQNLAITRVLDVGAHTGEFVRDLHSLGWNGLVDSFEPDPRSFPLLSSRSSKIDNWTAHQIAIGESRSIVLLHLAGNEVSSSTLKMLPLHVDAAPSSAATKVIEVEQDCLDSFIDPSVEQRIMLKIDVQGSEMKVLRGAELMLQDVVLAQIELSLQPLYEGQPLIDDVLKYMDQRDFLCCGLMPGFCDSSTGIMLQVDGVFVPRKELAEGDSYSRHAGR